MLHVPFDEYAIVSALLASAKRRGYLLSIYDGEAWPVSASRDYEAARPFIGATGETRLLFRDPSSVDALGKASVVGSVWLVHGNGPDVIHDHTDSEAMRAIVAPALAIAAARAV